MPKDRRLLLIAMSGVRIHDERLLKLGLNLPGFIERGKTIASLPSLGLLTIAAHTPPNWEIVYLEIDELEDNFASAQLVGYDLVAISSLTARISDAYRVADHLRNLGVAVIIGGLHVSVLPDEAKLHADSIVIGEGDAVWPSLISDFENGKLKKFYNSKEQSPSFSFANSMAPRYDLLDPTKYNRLTLQTTRGCPLDCSFCAASRLISRFKKKPIDLVRRDLEAILAIWPRPFIELADDNTFIDKRWSKELVNLFSEYEIRWFTETDISVADDEQLLENLAQSGCAQLLIGLESANRDSLAEIDNKNWKYEQFQNYQRKIDKIQSYGISVNGCLVLGHDSDTEAAFELTDQFISNSGLTEVQITVLTPFPGTALFQSLKSQGRLIADNFWDQCTLFDVTFHPAKMSIADLRDGFYDLMSKTYERSRVAARKDAMRRYLRRMLRQQSPMIETQN